MMLIETIFTKRKESLWIKISDIPIIDLMVSQVKVSDMIGSTMYVTRKHETSRAISNFIID